MFCLHLTAGLLLHSICIPNSHLHCCCTCAPVGLPRPGTQCSGWNWICYSTCANLLSNGKSLCEIKVLNLGVQLTLVSSFSKECVIGP